MNVNRATVRLDAEIIKTEEGAYLIKIQTGFGAPEIWVDAKLVFFEKEPALRREVDQSPWRSGYGNVP